MCNRVGIIINGEVISIERIEDLVKDRFESLEQYYMEILRGRTSLMVNLFANILNESDKIFQRKKNLVFLMFSVVIVPGAGALFAFGEKNLGIFAVTSSAFSILILSMFTSVLSAYLYL